MFEIKIKAEENAPKISDSVRIMNNCKSSYNKALRSAYQECKEGRLCLYIDKKYIDARHKCPYICYRFDFLTPGQIDANKNEQEAMALPYLDKAYEISDNNLRPVVVGSGPAGLFAAFILAKCGLRPILIERGSEMSKRIKDTDAFKEGKAKIDPESNVQFGEGGAGTFSDGKLYTGVTSGLKAYIARMLVIHGAPSEIMYDSHPHIGTDMLRKCVVGIRHDIEMLGGEVRFDTLFMGYRSDNGKLRSIIIKDKKGIHELDCTRLILAPGHSSRDTFRSLFDLGLKMEAKPFSVGVRIEHKREAIDKAQYGMDSASTNDLDAANYKLAVPTHNGKKLYTFCMCPGGTVVAAQTDNRSVCTNGMSYYARDLENSNSALLISVNSEEYGPGVLDGIAFQEDIEHKAFVAGGSNGRAPATTYKDLTENTIPEDFTEIIPSYRPGVTPADLRDIYPDYIIEPLIEGIKLMGRKIKGFDDPAAVLTAPETRSSSPVRILRGMDYQSVNLKGLFPCGEGAGYAGGIMSSAIDGINCANALIMSLDKDIS
ncbi:MAG: hypothetical protein K5745_05655 [Saccharofermentans sp.]|nr:hypothetical protein [Saccharofermentans sp.]